MALRRIIKGATLFWILIISIVLAFLAIAFIRLQPPKNRMDPTKIPKPVAVHEVQLKPLEILYETQGTVESSQRIDMNPEVSGMVQTIYVKEGQRVQRGQALLSLKAPRQAAQLQSSQANHQSIQAQIQSQMTLNDQLEADLVMAKSNLNLAQQEYNDFNKLYEEQVISRLERDQKLNALQNAQSRITWTKQKQRQNQSDIQKLKAMKTEAAANIQFNRAAMAESVIRAPFNGTVGKISVDPGDYIMPAEAILTLVNGSALEISFYVPEQHAPSIVSGQTVYIQTGSTTTKVLQENERQKGRVIFISPNIEPETRTLHVKASAPVSKNNLTDGQFVRIGLVLRTETNSITIPEEALVPQGEAQYVYLARQEHEGNSDKRVGPLVWKALFQKVEIGQRHTGMVQITHGLHEGDLVITNNQLKLFDGAPLVPPKTTKQFSPESPSTQHHTSEK